MKRTEESRGLSINTIINLLFGTSIVLTMCVTMVLIGLYRANQTITVYASDYSECENAVTEFKDASSFLTQQARLYVETFDLSYMRAYAQETVNEKRREAAVQVLEDKSIDVENEEYYQKAMQYSEAMKDIEVHAMKLAVVAAGDANKVLVIGDVKNYELSAKEIALSASEKEELARSLLYDKNYVLLQDSFLNSTNMLHINIFKLLDERINDATLFHKKMVFTLITFICVFFVVVFFSFIFLRESLLNPIILYMECIENGLKLPPKGAKEMQRFADVFNEMFEPIEKK